MENLCLYSLAKSVSPNILCCSKLWCGTGKVQVAQRERERVLQGRPLAGAGASVAVKPAHQTLQREGCGGDITKGSSHLLSSGQTQPDTKRQGTQPLTSGRGRQSGEEQGASLEVDFQMPGEGQGAGL